MSYQEICVEPIAPALGAEISGIDLSKPLDSDSVEELQLEGYGSYVAGGWHSDVTWLRGRTSSCRRLLRAL